MLLSLLGTVVEWASAMNVPVAADAWLSAQEVLSRSAANTQRSAVARCVHNFFCGVQVPALVLIGE